MSWEVEKDLDSPNTGRPPGSPLVLVGFVLGVMAVSPLATYWLLAWVVPLLLAGVFVVAAAFVGRRAWWFLHLAEGAAAATVSFVLFVVVGLASSWALGS